MEQVSAAFTQLRGAVDHGGEASLRRAVLQLAVILVASGVGARFARRLLKQPPVIGQILAGIALGPSLLGAAFPSAYGWLLPPDSIARLSSLAELGLLLLVFQVGLEIDFRKHLHGGGFGAAAVVGLLAFFTPLCAGFFSAPLFAKSLALAPKDMLGFQMIFACALAITAVPVLARIFGELGLTGSRTAALSVGAAALNDVLGWVVLGGIATFVHGSWELSTLLVQLAAIVVGLALLFGLAGPLLSRIVSHELSSNGGRLAPHVIGWVLLLLCIASLVSSSIGVFALIGGLLTGVALHGHRELADEWNRSVTPLVDALFVPLFFALTGLRTDLGVLHGVSGILVCLGIIAIAFLTKFGSAYAGARLCGEPHRTALAVGIAMNTRGLMELVALNIGLQLGILPPSMFTMLVLAAIVSTYIAAPLLRGALGLSTRSDGYRLASSSLLPTPGGVP